MLYSTVLYADDTGMLPLDTSTLASSVRRFSDAGRKKIMDYEIFEIGINRGLIVTGKKAASVALNIAANSLMRRRQPEGAVDNGT